MRIFYLLTLFLFLYLTVPLILPSANGQIYINEFSVDPSPQTVEIVNIGSTSADISGWYVDDNAGTTFYTIPQQTVLSPQSCALFSGDFNLNKSSPDSIRLFDSSAPPTSSTANLIDSFSYKTATSAGSYQRSPDGTSLWLTNSSSFGRLNTTLLSCIDFPVTPTVTLTPTASYMPTTPTPTTVNNVENITISEIMVNPNQSEPEWVELYNGNDYTVSLTSWYIDDAEQSGSSPQLFSVQIPPNSYIVIETSSIFNNNEDEVRLLNSNFTEKDTWLYESSKRGMSWIKKDDSICLSSPTKGTPNNDCHEETLNIFSAITPSPVAGIVQPARRLSVKPSIIIHISETPSEESPDYSKGTVLGEYSEKEVDPFINALSKSLSFSSFSFSLLTIFKLFLRMKSHL